MTDRDLPEVIADRYEVLAELGRGGMGVVYKAMDTLLSSPVALKVLPLSSPELVKRFQLEARALAQLKHPNIVTIFNFGVTDSRQPYMVMELIEGERLDQLISDDRLHLSDKIAILNQVSAALNHAHQKGILHRDVKPSNVMLVNSVEERPGVKLVDFGIAKLLKEEQALTAVGVGIGSPAYMSPEQVRGIDVDASSDIYSFGCLAYEILSGHNPFSRENRLETMQAQLEFNPPSLLESVPEVEPELDALVFKCIEKQTAQRFQSFGEVLDSLDKTCEDDIPQFHSSTVSTDVSIPTESTDVLAWQSKWFWIVSSLLFIGSLAVLSQFLERSQDKIVIRQILIDPDGQGSDLDKVVEKGFEFADPPRPEIIVKDPTVIELHRPTDKEIERLLSDFSETSHLTIMGGLDSQADFGRLVELKDLRILVLDGFGEKWKDARWIGKLAKLKSLSLIRYDGALAFLMDLPALETLNLKRFIDKTNEVRWISKIPRLKNLSLIQYDGTLSFLDKSPDLESITLNCFQGDSKEARWIGRIRHLKGLTLIQYDGKLSFLESLPELQFLSLQSCATDTDTFCNDLQGLKLNMLHLKRPVDLTADNLRCLTKVPSLEELRLDIGYLNLEEKRKELYDAISEINSLTSLWLFGVKMDEVTGLDGLPRLDRLCLRDSSIGPGDIARLSRVPNLERIDFEKVVMERGTLRRLAQLPLTSLRLRKVDFQDEADIRLLANMYTLKRVDLVELPASDAVKNSLKASFKKRGIEVHFEPN